MKHLFCLGGLSSVSFCDKECTMEHSTCKKLNLEIDGQEMNGYIIKRNQRNLTVQLIMTRQLRQDVLNGIKKIWNISIPPQQPIIQLHYMSQIYSPSCPLLDNLNT